MRGYNFTAETYQSERPDLMAGAETLAHLRKMYNFLIADQIEQQRSIGALSDAHYFIMMQRANRILQSIDILRPALPPPSMHQFENEWGPKAELINTFLTVQTLPLVMYNYYNTSLSKIYNASELV